MTQTPDKSELFVGLLAQHERRLATYIMTLVPHWSDAEDILQEVKLVMWREFDRFTIGTNFGAWACAIAFHRVMAHRKKRGRDKLKFSDEFVEAVAAEVDGSAERLEERHKLLAGCIAKLQAPHRRIIQMRYQDGMDIESIAAAAGRTIGALYRVLSRLRRTLHECVTKATETV
jgi:RNA polymerase sigma-70 factor (ECF subfamily)